jgi:hypothetical protein
MVRRFVKMAAAMTFALCLSGALSLGLSLRASAAGGDAFREVLRQAGDEIRQEAQDTAR